MSRSEYDGKPLHLMTLDELQAAKRRLNEANQYARSQLSIVWSAHDVSIMREAREVWNPVIDRNRETLGALWQEIDSHERR